MRTSPGNSEPKSTITGLTNSSIMKVIAGCSLSVFLRNRRLLLTVSASFILVLPQLAGAQVYNRATYSSPVAISADDTLIWVVNPADDSVSVIRPDNNTRITKITVGDEPQSIALTPNGQYAYVANAAGGSVTIIQINNPAWGSFSANVVGTLTTGAEPWNIVCTPDGK